MRCGLGGQAVENQDLYCRYLVLWLEVLNHRFLIGETQRGSQRGRDFKDEVNADRFWVTGVKYA